MFHESTGSGFPVVLIHTGIADGRMWAPQWASFGGYRLVRVDLPGFGRSPVEQLPLSPAREVVQLLDELEIAEAAVVGGSMGGRVSLEVAIARPELVRALVLVDSGLPDFDWSEDVRRYGAVEDEAVERGDLEGAIELNLRMWVDGPRRSPAEVDPAVRSAVADMQRRALELQAPLWERLDEELLVPDVAGRLSEVQAPTLVVAGEEDVEDFLRIARRLADEIPQARLATIPGAAHLPSLERPELFDPLVLGFLSDALS